MCFKNGIVMRYFLLTLILTNLAFSQEGSSPLTTPDGYEYYYKIRELIEKNKDYKQAYQVALQAVIVYPENTDMWNVKGQTELYLRYYDDAYKSYEKAIELDNKNYEAFNKLSEIDIVKKRFEQAIKNAKAAIDLNPEHHQAYNNLGLAYKKIKQYNRALRSYDKALKIKWDNAVVHYNKACLLAIQNKKSDALKSLEYAVFQEPKFKEYAAGDSDFNKIKNSSEFKKLLN